MLHAMAAKTFLDLTTGTPFTELGAGPATATPYFSWDGATLTLVSPGTIVQQTALGGVTPQVGAAFVAGVTYAQGAIVSGSDSQLYVSIAGGNVGNDPTTDAGVHWKLASELQASIITASGAIANVETVVVKLAILPGKTLRAGSKVRITLEGTCNSSVGNVPTFTIRAGILGTTADASVAAIALPAAGTGAAPIAFKAVIEFTVQTLGAAGTCAGSLTLIDNATGGLSTTLVNVVPFTSATLATTTATFLDVTFVAAAATTTCTFADASIEVAP